MTMTFSLGCRSASTECWLPCPCCRGHVVPFSCPPLQQHLCRLPSKVSAWLLVVCITLLKALSMLRMTCPVLWFGQRSRQAHSDVLDPDLCRRALKVPPGGAAPATQWLPGDIHVRLLQLA